MKASQWVASLGLIAAVAAVGAGLAMKKKADIQKSMAEAAMMPEPMEAVIVQSARETEHRRVTTAVGSVLALRSVTLKNELAGTVEKVDLTPGKIVEAGEVLVALDVSVEEAELKALEAQAALTEATLKRVETLTSSSASSKKDLDQARAERDVALAQTERTKAMIARKMIRAPFRAKIGLSDVHPGQYLVEGTELTTLQGVDEAVFVDFAITQAVAVGLKEGDVVEVVGPNKDAPVSASIVALDARIDRATRSAWVRAKVADASKLQAPGASVQVRVPVGAARKMIAIPVSALRRGPEGDHVFVVMADKEGKPRASLRLVQGGTVQGDEVLIEKGLAVGDQVAASGSFKLREGVLVADVGKAPQEKQAH
ncbi:efflux RND transporter periplasmic adaptor subunit [Luteolibacter sp. GHJ8]|jgi:RND family efflux transporter MFP subunit|uniref:Efflux RND transporter periplasmic adaptor subunit n=1 Tax=Luteolibacter rhizosphaerae TaxID=2989719 RepID=A0ABT3G4B3_9BACT|nr:efflux RND transporter periplasmic adaptor subunit [Luteolibacter rhizosphaerae]MCW1914691.1 efflux RND transporter periplasmic adaptor subunit [Luteolibacter rhizosphaerae]